MADTRRTKERHIIGAESALTGIIALLVDEREARTAGDKSVMRTEVLLSNAGLSFDDIAAATGKNADAVRMAVSRAMRA